MKACTDDKINMTIFEIGFVKGKNIVGKGENAGYQRFLLFPQLFQKASLLEVIKLSVIKS